MVKFPQGNYTASKKAIMVKKVKRTATSTKNVFQSRSSNESNMLSTTFGPAEINQDESKEV